jgi:diaminopimelate epimerase
MSGSVIPFYKMHGAANDFIVVDDRVLSFPTDDQAWLSAIMARHTGVGSEGVLLIQPSERADFRMRFFNPDGGEVDMCGNGARCIARLAHELGVSGEQMTFETPAGLVGATMIGQDVRLDMTAPKDWKLDGALDMPGGPLAYGFVNSGVPHVVVEVTDIESFDVQGTGAFFRHHALFAPGGTNANFIEITGPSSLRLRTYERGVEAETPACGTGIVASALIAGKTGRVTAPVHVHTAGGHTLEVNYQLTPDGAEKVTLQGPAEHVFQGELPYRRRAD